MAFLPETGGNRREFFRAAARYGLLGGLAAVGWLALGARRASGQRCVNRGWCRGCAVFEACGLPAALSAKDGRRVAGS